MIRVKRLITLSSCSVNSSMRQSLTRQLSQLQRAFASLRDTAHPLTSESDTHLVHQCKERLQQYKTSLKELSNKLLAMNLEDTDELCTSYDGLETLMLECDLMIKKLGGGATPTLLSFDNTGVKLPKLEAPSFDGKFTNWVSFWEQFNVAIHSRTTLSDVEKLAYLRNALKDGSAKGIIEGLSTSGEFYPEAITALKNRYDRPRLILQSHVRAILEVPDLKDGGGREIRTLHDTVQQHLRALKAMSCAPPGPFIT